MGKGQETVSSRSGSSHGAPLMIDYKEAIAALSDSSVDPPSWGGVVTARDVGDLIRKKGSHVRELLMRARKAGKVRFVLRGRGFIYSAKDVYEFLKEELPHA